MQVRVINTTFKDLTSTNNNYEMYLLKKTWEKHYLNIPSNLIVTIVTKKVPQGIALKDNK
jgi:hypothetical protein